MFPFWIFDDRKRKPSREENIRVFKVVLYFLIAVAVSFLAVTYLVFGHF
jgi:preprotein translocase subunit SecE